MSWNEGAFGKLLCKRFSKFKFTRIPNITREYFITTRGLVIRGGQKGPGDLLEWDKIKEPGTSDGLDILGFDIAGTVKFNTPISVLQGIFLYFSRLSAIFLCQFLTIFRAIILPVSAKNFQNFSRGKF